MTRHAAYWRLFIDSGQMTSDRNAELRQMPSERVSGHRRELPAGESCVACHLRDRKRRRSQRHRGFSGSNSASSRTSPLSSPPNRSIPNGGMLTHTL